MTSFPVPVTSRSAKRRVRSCRQCSRRARPRRRRVPPAGTVRRGIGRRGNVCWLWMSPVHRPSSTIRPPPPPREGKPAKLWFPKRRKRSSKLRRNSTTRLVFGPVHRSLIRGAAVGSQPNQLGFRFQSGGEISRGVNKYYYKLLFYRLWSRHQWENWGKVIREATGSWRSWLKSGTLIRTLFKWRSA